MCIRRNTGERLCKPRLYPSLSASYTKTLQLKKLHYYCLCNVRMSQIMLLQGLIDFQFHLIFTYMVCHFITVGIHHKFFLSIWTYKDIYIYIILSMICHFTSVGAIICFYCGKLKISKVIMIVTFLIKLWPNTANLYNCVYYF